MKHLFLTPGLVLMAALAVVSCGGDDGGDDPIIPDTPSTPTGTVTITTPTVSDITTTTATVRAQVTATNGLAVASRGFCYATMPAPTTEGNTVKTSLDDMLTVLAGLQPATIYYVRGYAVTALGTTYSAEATFTTEDNKQGASLDTWTAPVYADDYRSISTWANRSKWNLANVHDPTVVKGDDGYYYMYCTDAGYGNPQAGHGHFHCRRSADLVNWTYIGAAMPTTPTWVKPKLNEIRKAMGLAGSTANTNDYGYWAPCVRKVRDGLYRMYYAIVVPGTIDGDGTWSERAFIGLMETDNLASNDWQDKGFVITTYSDRELNYKVKADNWQQCYYKYNAIDPSYIITPEGEHWLVYGSWHSGFAAVQLNAETGKTIVDPLPNPWGAENEAAYGKRIFTRKAGDRWQGAEAPEIVYKDGYYYLFMAYDALDVPYNTRVVRSEKIDGPYKSVMGTNVTAGGEAFPLLTHPYQFSGSQGWVGISHCAVFDDGQGNWYYASQQRFPTTAGGNAPNAVMMGGVRSMQWTKDGWPVVMPERYAAVPQETITGSDIVGTWEHIDMGYKYGVMKTSTTMTFAADGTITEGPWKGGKWTYDAATGTLTANGVELKVQRECDWESAPRKHTIVYAGINGQKSYWGKKN